jgi:hypothetical protein
MIYSEFQIEAAIAAEAIDWAPHFEVTDPVQIEGRRNVMRANVKVGYLSPLAQYLDHVQAPIERQPFKTAKAAHDALVELGFAHNPGEETRFRYNLAHTSASIAGGVTCYFVELLHRR